jgi:hypothetical protein
MPDSSERRAWLAGRCPCCKSGLWEWEWDGVVTEPEVIAEGVTMCGRCIANEHDRDDMIAEILRLLVP